MHSYDYSDTSSDNENCQSNSSSDTEEESKRKQEAQLFVDEQIQFDKHYTEIMSRPRESSHVKQKPIIQKSFPKPITLSMLDNNSKTQKDIKSKPTAKIVTKK